MRYKRFLPLTITAIFIAMSLTSCVFPNAVSRMLIEDVVKDDSPTYGQALIGDV